MIIGYLLIYIIYIKSIKIFYSYLILSITNLFSIPTDISIYFSFSDTSRPFFLNVIQSTIDYDEAVHNHKNKDLEEIKKIIVNEIPHLNDGTLYECPVLAKDFALLSV